MGDTDIVEDAHYFNIITNYTKYSGGVAVWYDTNQDDDEKRDLCVMICDCTETREKIAIWKEDVIA